MSAAMNRKGLPRWVEASLALAVLIAVSPLMLIVAVLVKLTSRGPVLYSQRRVGVGGRPFTMRKFRTMTVSGRGPKVTARDDARMTAVGRVLRKLKLDELPELWNVVRGDMALVGPRPEVPDYVDWSDPVARSVMRARPGVTDPMTLKLRNEEELLASVPGDHEAFYRARLRPFKEQGYRNYLTNRSWWTDLSVLLRSVIVVVAPKLAPPVTVQDVESASSQSAAGQKKTVDRLLPYRRPFIVLFQIGLVIFSHWAALWLRFDGVIPERDWSLFLIILPLVVGLRLLAFVPFRLFEGFWRYVGIWDLRNIVAAVVSSSVVAFVIVRFHYGFMSYPRSVFVIDTVLLILLLGGARVFFQYVGEHNESDGTEKRVLIFGAGDAGAMIVREMAGSPRLGYRAIGFVDDDPAKAGMRIYGVPVLGTREDLPRIMREKRPAEVLLAVPRADVGIVRSMVMALAPYKATIKTLPNVREILDGTVNASQMRSLAIEDLLSRSPVGLDRAPLKKLIEGRRVLVTGAGGSIGSELCRQIASFRPATLVLYERYENSLYTIANDLADRGLGAGVHAVLGDVTDERRLDAVVAAYAPELVFHAAAHKHVPLMEANPCEAVKNNVTGTRLLAAVAERYGVDRFVLISSDKAVNPSSVMGATKRIDEWIVRLFADRGRTTFITVRFGNVLGSSGSVVPRFLDQIRAGGPVTVTHPDMRRYFMLTSEAVQLVLHAAALGRNSATYVLEMGEQISVLELARNMIRLAGYIPDEEIPIAITGLRPGEKLYEELVAHGERVEPSSIPDILHVEGADPIVGIEREIARLEELARAGDVTGVIEQLHRVVPGFRDRADGSSAAGHPAAAGSAAMLPGSPLTCPSCGSMRIGRSRTRTPQEKAQKETTDERLYACRNCDWRGWLLPPEQRDAVSAVMGRVLADVDLGSVDAALAPGTNIGARKES